MIVKRQKFQQIRIDNGPEFTTKVFTTSCQKNGITIKYIKPGKPMQNDYMEKLNRTFREDILAAGRAMGSVGSDATIETADAVIQNHQPSKIVSSIKIGKITRSIVWQNITEQWS